MTLLTDQRLAELREYLGTPPTRHETIPCVLQQGMLYDLVEREIERRTVAEAKTHIIDAHVHQYADKHVVTFDAKLLHLDRGCRCPISTAVREKIAEARKSK